MTARALMFQGTGSDVGKSLIVAGLARALATRGLKVRPFKPQNMSNNAAVTIDGGEIGRAQALQARAARVPPSVHMNPVLLKPQSEVGAQIVVQGRVYGTAKAADYQNLKPKLMAFVRESFAQLKEEADIVLVEGAGSASEVNLRANDIANMGFARACGRARRAHRRHRPRRRDREPRRHQGGSRRRRRRADRRLPRQQVPRRSHALRRRHGAGRRGDRLGGARPHPLLPRGAGLAGRGRARARRRAAQKAGAAVKIAVPLLPHIANFDDLDPLDAEPAVDLVRVRPGEALPADAGLVILPGSKAVISDLKALKDAGFDIDIAAHVRRGGMVLGLCGGYQMLGRAVHDPDGIEGPAGTAPGLGLLDVETRLSAEKRLEPARGTTFDGAPFSGYEMHMGVTEGPDCARPFARLADGTPEGAMSANGRVIGTYVHGLFADDRQRAAWLARFSGGPAQVSYEASVDAILDRLAAHLEAHVDVDRLLTLSR